MEIAANAAGGLKMPSLLLIRLWHSVSSANHDRRSLQISSTRAVVPGSRNSFSFKQREELTMETLNAVDTKPGENAIALAALERCDTVFVQTRSSNYRIFLLDPKSGRALVQGGLYLGQPVEATVAGSGLGGPVLKIGSIDVGLRLEISANGKRLTTSPVQSFRVERGSEQVVGVEAGP
jgi:hypothetical protein